MSPRSLMIELVTMGTILKEIIKFPEKTIGPVLGSPAAYSSVAAARLGVKTGIITKIGTDMPQELLQPFLEAGVDLRGLHVENVTTTNLLVYHEDGSKEIIYLKQASPIFPSDIPEEYMKADIVHICPMNYEVPISTVKFLKEQGLTLSTDVAGYGGAASIEHPANNPERATLFEELIGLFDIVKASLEDCVHIFGARSDLKDYAMRRIIELGARIAIITLGKDGAVGMDETGAVYEIPPYPVKVVDPTGAGDVFCAGFLAEFIRSGDWRKSMISGSVTASFVIEKSGGVLPSRMPTIEDVRERIKHYMKYIR
ncbi:MAG TPA: carbohydrate kinase family protein [Nitrososphaeria archaeon]|nr:carbohydrate kinase family protein [Nitrososphaeria archaeon]